MKNSVNCCPSCGSIRFWKDGFRPRVVGSANTVQRYLCRTCGHRFSQPATRLHVHSYALKNAQSAENHHPVEIRSMDRVGKEQKRLMVSPEVDRICRVGDLAEESVNLTSATELKTVAGDEGRIAQYEWKCKKRQLQQNTIDLRTYHLRNLVKDGAELNNPETVETVLATKDYPTATRWLANEAYHSYCKMFGIQWEKLNIKYQPKMPYIPTEEECWLFISAISGKTISIVCRTLFETGCRIGELHAIERMDVNEEACIINIQHPEKNSNPRPLKVSADLVGLLKSLPLTYGNNLFNPKNGSYVGAFYRQRKRVADRLGKPQYLKIHFHTFRHARASIDIANGVPLFEVKQNLGHKSILNTEKYVHWNKQLYHEKNDRYYYKAVSTDEEAGKCIEEGMQYVCTNPTTLRMLFRKAK